jgi:E3 ubiquitin-protein ligase HERC4
VQQIACGHAHSVLLTDGSEVWSCGSNEKGQCGQETSSTRPARIDSLSVPGLRVTQVACGHSHSLALTAEGLLYAWGSNEHGQLGVSPSSTSHLGQPRPIESLPPDMKVLQVACGGHHNLALMNSGRVFSWGSNRYGQLGLRATALMTLSQPLVHTLCTSP